MIIKNISLLTLLLIWNLIRFQINSTKSSGVWYLNINFISTLIKFSGCEDVVLHLIHGCIAQLAEQYTFNVWVRSSSLRASTIRLCVIKDNFHKKVVTYSLLDTKGWSHRNSNCGCRNQLIWKFLRRLDKKSMWRKPVWQRPFPGFACGDVRWKLVYKPEGKSEAFLISNRTFF